MTTVRVNVFEGTGSQIPNTFDITANTYQDIVSALINTGQYSGQIYGLQGEIIDYNAPITLPEVNYIIPEGEDISEFTIENNNTIYVIHKMKQTSTVRDLYNNLIAQGVPIGTIIRRGYRFLNMDELLFEINNPFKIEITIPDEHQPTGVVENIQIITPTRGIVTLKIIYGVTTARSITVVADPVNRNEFRLAIVSRGDFMPQILNDDQVIPRPTKGQRFYLVPNYETLFEAYATFIENILKVD